MDGDSSRSRTLVSELASFVSELSVEDIPENGIELTERCFLDTVGVMLAGSTDEAGRIAARTVEASGGSGPSSFVGRTGSASVTDAAFVNGTAGHALDYDDVCDVVNGHPSVTMIAGLLAVGEAERVAGEDLLGAYVAGFETQCALARPVMPGHYEAGWHTTATIGTFGTAAAVAALLDLDSEETKHALNLAASMASGLVRNFGTAAKPMHAGTAARAGVTAGLLAERGFTADSDAITAVNGFFALTQGPSGVDLADRVPLGERWAIVEDGVHVKKYPCCYFTHTPIAAAARLAADHDLAPEDVESIRVRAAPGAGDVLTIPDPKTGAEGKFSMPYTVACAIVHDRVDLTAFEDEQVAHPDVQVVRETVSFEVDPELSYHSRRSTVTVETTAGRTHTATVETPPGTYENPLSDAELHRKFTTCATQSLTPDAAERAYERLYSLRELEDITTLLECC